LPNPNLALWFKKLWIFLFRFGRSRAWEIVAVDVPLPSTLRYLATNSHEKIHLVCIPCSGGDWFDRGLRLDEQQ